MNEEKYWDILRNVRSKGIIRVADDLKCHLCEDIMIDAHGIPCGCIFCKDCITRYLRDKNKCPNLNEACSEYELDSTKDLSRYHNINRKIENIQIMCINDGCNDKMKLKNIPQHLSVCNFTKSKCPYYEMGCGEEEIENKMMSYHLRDEYDTHTEYAVEYVDKLKNKIELLQKEKEEILKELSEARAVNGDLNRSQFDWIISNFVDQSEAAKYDQSVCIRSDEIYLEGYNFVFNLYPYYFNFLGYEQVGVCAEMRESVHECEVEWPCTKVVCVSVLDTERCVLKCIKVKRGDWCSAAESGESDRADIVSWSTIHKNRTFRNGTALHVRIEIN